MFRSKATKVESIKRATKISTADSVDLALPLKCRSQNVGSKFLPVRKRSKQKYIKIN